MRVLFDRHNRPVRPEQIEKHVESFGKSYCVVVREVIEKTDLPLTKKLFCENVSKLLPNFKMTRRGPFKGVRYEGKECHDPDGIVSRCWSLIGGDLIQLREFLHSHRWPKRGRFLAEVASSERDGIFSRLNKTFEKLRPACEGKVSKGRVGASKILFAVLPEMALPVDNVQWNDLFKTDDYGVVIKRMTEEILSWEMATGYKLDECDHYQKATLPSVYNVMAMKARPLKEGKKA